MSYYAETLAEIQMQKAIVKQCKEILASTPKGSLYIRPRKKGAAFYQIQKIKTDKGWKNTEKNITDNPDLILALTEKKLAEEQLKRCEINLKYLKQLAVKYAAYDFNSVAESLAPSYNSAWTKHIEHLLEIQANAPYDKAPVYADRHIHKTTAGFLVRSKSEVIIANLLHSYGIPFRYEEKFPYPNEDGKYYYPDFVILLPNGERIYWEHLGLLSNKKYCIHNAEKLHHYQLNGVYIGKNLIITQDDNDGNCNSAFTEQIIQTFILSHFKRKS